MFFFLHTYIIQTSYDFVIPGLQHSYAYEWKSMEKSLVWYSFTGLNRYETLPGIIYSIRRDNFVIFAQALADIAVIFIVHFVCVSYFVFHPCCCLFKTFTALWPTAVIFKWA